MAQVHQITARLNSAKKLPEDARINLSFSHIPLMQAGFNMLVSISGPKVEAAGKPQDVKSVVVMAHFDTGASRTSIDTKLASHLGLVPVGAGIVHTAAGPKQLPNFAVTLSFPGTRLSPFINIPIGSCNLPFQIGEDGSIALSAQNFGLLLGRDVMSHWNIVWNGPTSSVFVSD